MTAWIDELAAWWLRRRGVTVLPRAFLGIAMGHCDAYEGEDGSMRVYPPPQMSLIALNHTSVTMLRPSVLAPDGWSAAPQ